METKKTTLKENKKGNLNFVEQMLEHLEPWCSTIYVGHGFDAKHYIDREQPNTVVNLDEKILSIDAEKENEKHKNDTKRN